MINEHSKTAIARSSLALGSISEPRRKGFGGTVFSQRKEERWLIITTRALFDYITSTTWSEISLPIFFPLLPMPCFSQLRQLSNALERLTARLGPSVRLSDCLLSSSPLFFPNNGLEEGEDEI